MTATKHDPAPIGLRLLLLSALLLMAGIVLVVSGHLDQPDPVEAQTLAAFATQR